MHQHVSVSDPPSPFAHQSPFQTKEWILPAWEEMYQKWEYRYIKQRGLEQTRSKALEHKCQALIGEIEKLTRILCRLRGKRK